MALYRVLCLTLLVVGGGAWIFPNVAFSRSNCNSFALTLASTESRAGGIDPDAIARIRAASLNKQRELKESATIVEGLLPDPSTKKKSAKKKKTTARKRKTPEEKEAELLKNLEKEQLEVQMQQLKEESAAALKAAEYEAKLRDDIRARELHQAKLLYNYTDAKGNASTVPFIKASKWYTIKVPTGTKAQTLDYLKTKIIASSDHPLRGLIIDAVLEYIPSVNIHRAGVLKNTFYLDVALAKNDFIFIRSSIMHPKIVKTLEQEKIPDIDRPIKFERNEGYIVPISAGRAQDIIDSSNIEHFAEASEKLSQITIGSYVIMDDYKPDEDEEEEEIIKINEEARTYFGRVNGARNGKLDLQLIINDEETLQRLYYPIDQVTLTDKKPTPKAVSAVQKVTLEKKLKSRARKMKLSHISTYKELDSALFDETENTDLQLQIDDGSINRFLQDDYGDWDINDRRQLERFLAIYGFEHPFLRSFVKTQMFTDIMHQRGSRRIFEKYLIQYDPDYFIKEERPRRGSNSREYNENRLANRELRQFDRQFDRQVNNKFSTSQPAFDENMISNLVKNAAQKAMYTIENNYEEFGDDWGAPSKNKGKGEEDVFEEDFSFLDDLIPSSESKSSPAVAAASKSSSGGSSIDDFFDDDFVLPPPPSPSPPKKKSKAANNAFSSFGDDRNENDDEVDDLMSLLAEEDDDSVDDTDSFIPPPPPSAKSVTKPVVKAVGKPLTKPVFTSSTTATISSSNNKWKPKDTSDMSIDDFLDSFTSPETDSQGEYKGDNRLDSLISEIGEMLGDTNLNFNFNDINNQGRFDSSQLFPNSPRVEELEPEQDYEDFMKQMEREFMEMEMKKKTVDLASSSFLPAVNIIEKDGKPVKKPSVTKETVAVPVALSLSDDSTVVDSGSSEVKKKPAARRSKKIEE